MMPLNWSANVRMPYYGWFGANGFDSPAAARAWIAKMYRDFRRDSRKLIRPAYAGRSYIVRAYLLQED
jgi:hypothetical protein